LRYKAGSFRSRSFNATAGLTLAALIGMASAALAQMPTPTETGPSTPPIAGMPPRIEVNPRPLLFRRCTSWYVIQNRPSGRVLFPEKHCWWVRG
jgi:hypothetical protein